MDTLIKLLMILIIVGEVLYMLYKENQKVKKFMDDVNDRAKKFEKEIEDFKDRRG